MTAIEEAALAANARLKAIAPTIAAAPPGRIPLEARLLWSDTRLDADQVDHYLDEMPDKLDRNNAAGVDPQANILGLVHHALLTGYLAGRGEP